MEALTVLKALKITYVQTPQKTLADLEMQLSPAQLEWWTNLKIAIKEVENKTAQGIDWEDFKKELAYEDSIAQTV